MKSIRLLGLILAFVLFTADCKKKPTATATPLHRAANEGNIERVRSLISSGANINAKAGRYARTPLYEAAYYGHKDIVALLV
jgi:hypothetical protein